MATKGPDEYLLPLCMACAINSLPVPLSPSMSILELLLAAFSVSLIIFIVAGELPMIEEIV